MFRTSILCFLLALFPGSVSAAVLINEIAWMGTENSANDEWIELYNTGDPVDLAGWVLTDNTSLDIMLEGTLAGHTWAVLERTDDSSAPGTAFLIYTGALSNDGRTLTLLRPDGSIEDQVAGGENWEEVGGDNDTKDTAQRTESGWITAAPTPGVANATSPAITEEADVDAGVADRTGEGRDEDDDEVIYISLEEPDSELSLSVEGPTRAYVNQPVTFAAGSSGLGDILLQSLHYTWNYGDSYTGRGKEVVHAYTHPGSYVVVARAVYKDHEARTRHDITVLPVTFSLGRAENGDVLVHNDAKYEVNVGGYTLRGDTTFVLPKDTILVPNATIRIPRSRVEEGASKMLILYDEAGDVVASHVPAQLTSADDASASERTVARSTVQPASSVQAEVSEGADNTRIDATAGRERVAAASGTKERPVGGLAAAAGASGNDRLPYLALIGVILIGILAVYSRRVL